MPYTPHTPQETKQMLQAIGLKNESELFACIPNELKNSDLNLPPSQDEFSIYENFKQIANKNDVSKLMFMGGGYYDHIVPSSVDALSSRSEFYTAYTPYQAEASAGTLTMLYEYQSLMCELSGMDISNASMYDGATALCESALMAVRITKKAKIVVCGSINPVYLDVLQSYMDTRDIELVIIKPNKNNPTASDEVALKDAIDDSVGGFIVATPNFFGEVIDYKELIEYAHSHKALSIMSFYPIALGMFQEPGSLGVDIACGDGLCLGNYLNLGGPSLGILTCKEEYVRNLPGRIIGKTTDKNNNEAFTLTLQAREQHIRRNRATSNICSNQNLIALRASIFLSLLGKEGFYELAMANYNNGNYLKSLLSKIKGIKVLNTNETFNEFVYQVDGINAKDLLHAFEQKGIYGGLNLQLALNDTSGVYDNAILVCASEKRSKSDMDLYAKELESILQEANK